MEVTALHVKLLVNVLLLLNAMNTYHVHKAVTDAAFLHVDPNRLQFFEYECISLHCAGFDGPTEWRVMTNTSQWETSTGSLIIKLAFARHSGEYWCENGDGERSNTVNVIVTAGDVILESPALPVMEQQTATLRCRRRTTSKNSADFFKDGRFIKTGYTGYMTIPNISMSDEGLYNCSISGAGGSAASRLAVTEYRPTTPTPLATTSQEGSPPPSPPSHPVSIQLIMLLSIVFAMLCVTVMLLVLGLRQCENNKVHIAGLSSEIPTTQSEPVVPVNECPVAADPQIVGYASVRKHKKNTGGFSYQVPPTASEPVNEHAGVADPPKATRYKLYASIRKHQKKTGQCQQNHELKDEAETVETD